MSRKKYPFGRIRQPTIRFWHEKIWLLLIHRSRRIEQRFSEKA
jgi:hypothetical protein